VQPNILRNNRWRCDHGWDIDLDDGSSYYDISNNLCLHGGIKNREGFGRIVANNILVGSGFYPHVWFAGSGDMFIRNIVWQDYEPARMYRPPWGQEMDYNLLYRAGAAKEPATSLQLQSGGDEHSLVADAQFVNPARGDYRVRDRSPALDLGFVNFAMDQFGVQKPELRAIARTPLLPSVTAEYITPAARDTTPRAWLGAKIRNIANEGEMSAFGLPGVTGVLVLEVSAGSSSARAGLQKNDVILSVDGQKTDDVSALFQQAPVLNDDHTYKVGVRRNQNEIRLALEPLN
jgi:hypothetical protein